jgi:hypothetical protein
MSGTPLGQLCKTRGKRWLVVFAMVALAMLAPLASHAQTVRGRIQKGQFPIIGVAVNVFSPNLGASGFSYTGQDGMYYLYNIPPGPYTLQVWAIPGSAPLQYQIVVYAQPFVDIAPIFLP